MSPYSFVRPLLHIALTAAKHYSLLYYMNLVLSTVMFTCLQMVHIWQKEWWDAGMVICLGRGADLHMSQLMALLLTISCSSKSRLVLPFWYRLTRVVPDKVQGAIKW